MPRLSRPAVSALWSLLGDKQTSHGQPISVAFDPGCVKTCTSQECADEIETEFLHAD